MLTTKQEKFVQNLVKGMSQREAYKKSYNAKKMKNETIDNKASLLFKKDEVRKRYFTLLDKVEKKTIMTAQERMKWLSDVVNNNQYEEDDNGFKFADLNTKMKAIDIMNKMDGQYVTKVEGNISVDKLEDLL